MFHMYDKKLAFLCFQVPTKHRYFATFHSPNYCILPASIAMKNNCFNQTSYGEEEHQLYGVQLPLHGRMIIRYTSIRKMGFRWDLASTRMLFNQTSYGEEVHQCMVSSFHCIEE